MGGYTIYVVGCRGGGTDEKTGGGAGRRWTGSRMGMFEMQLKLDGLKTD